MGPFGFQLSRPLHYAVYFFAGLGVGAVGIERGLLATDGMLARRWALWFGVWIASFLLWIIPMALIFNDSAGAPLWLRILAEFGFVLACASGCFFLAAVFLQFATGRSRVLGSLSDNAYGMYLIHYVFVIWLQYALLPVPLFAVVKAAIVFSGTLVASWALTAAMRSVPFGSRLIGAERRVLAKAP
jgi:surface polysaccharide O-acyltransferase-like enzyme